MAEPRCWLCNRKMKLERDKDGFWLHCGPCAATYMEGEVKRTRDEFLACYDMFYREKRCDGQISIFDGVQL